MNKNMARDKLNQVIGDFTRIAEGAKDPVHRQLARMLRKYAEQLRKTENRKRQIARASALNRKTRRMIRARRAGNGAKP